jgi:hypothetical protein
MARPVLGSAAAGPSGPDGQPADGALPTGSGRPGRWPSWGRSGARRPWLRRLGWTVGLAVVAGALFLAYLRLSNTYPENSDQANLGLAAWDMLHGNLLLHGWVLSDVSFYTTELPQYALLELINGLSPGTFHAAAAMTYTLVLLLTVLLAMGRAGDRASDGADGREGVTRALIAGGMMLAPQLGVGVFILLLSVGHFGTSVPLLLTWLVLDRGRPRWYVPVLAALLLAWASIADTLVLVAGVAPLAAVALVRVAGALIARQGWRAVRYPLSLAVAAGAAAALWAGAAPALRALGAYTVHPVPFHVIAWSDLGAHARTTGLSLLALFGASFRGVHGGWAVTFAAFHLVGLAAAGVTLIMVVSRFFRRSLVDQLLAVAIVATLLLYLGSNFSSGILNGREIAIVLPFSAALTARTLAPRLTRPRPAPKAAPLHPQASLWPQGLRRSVAAFLAVALAGYAACLGYQLTQPSVPAANARLAGWLSAHHLSHGLSGYWQASSVTVASAGSKQTPHVTIRALAGHFSGVVPYEWETKPGWFDWRTQYANFIVLQNQPGYFTYWEPTSQLKSVFGTPAVTYHTGPYTILVYHQNLLLTLHQWEQSAS